METGNCSRKKENGSNWFRIRGMSEWGKRGLPWILSMEEVFCSL